MQSAFWAHAHGATTHFPIALVVCSGAADLIGFAMRERSIARDLNTVGYWTLLLGAIGAVPAALSGLFMTRGSLLGHGALRWHHVFVWPAASLIIGLATWRFLVKRNANRRAFSLYLGAVACAIALLLGAGYWGGELMMRNQAPL